MFTLPERDQQIIQSHAPFIVSVVMACQDPGLVSEVEPVLKAAESMGQQVLAGAIRKILEGSREPELVQGLDQDDAVIVDAILRGLQDPNTLPDPNKPSNPAAAAPGLANIIREAASGDPQALQMIDAMAEQMTSMGGSMAQMGSSLHQLVEGVRDPDVLCENMDANATVLVVKILDELGKQEIH
jgi:hypothetical protein